MAVVMHGRSTGPTSTEVTHEPSGRVVATTAPKDNGGDGSSFSPTDLCAAALGACATTIMMMYGKNNGIELARVDFSVAKEMHPSPRRLGKLTTVYRLATRCSDEDFARLVRAGKSCPVRLSLGPDVVVEETYERVAP
jgi:uncharacterized OsmC-like protein